MLIIKNADELITCRTYTRGPRVGRDFSDCGVIKNGTIVVDKEKILAVGETKKILARFRPKTNDTVIDASDKIVLPGFVDCHTHAVFGGSRAEEYRWKLTGSSYETLHKKGGGIFSTVEATRKASENLLFFRGQSTLRQMLERGTTTVEIKSGYGLSLKEELKILRVIKRLSQTQAQDIVSTFLGAHTIPLRHQTRRHLYIKGIIEKMLPKIAAGKLAEYCDVFCDPLGFTPDETRKIFSAAEKLGLGLRIHAEQTGHFGGVKVAAQFKTSSVDHCDFISDRDINLLKKSGGVAVFLPGVLFHLMEWDKIKLIREVIQKIKKSNLPLALATDYNPGSSPVISLKIIMDLALRFFGLSYEECINAVTINAAWALDRGEIIGSLEKGKQADILVVDSSNFKDFLHQVGDKNIGYVIKKGKVLVKLTHA